MSVCYTDNIIIKSKSMKPMSPNQIYHLLDEMNENYQNPPEGSVDHPDYGKETLPDDIKVTDIKF